jgi:hypothetical protein
MLSPHRVMKWSAGRYLAAERDDHPPRPTKLSEPCNRRGRQQQRNFWWYPQKDCRPTPAALTTLVACAELREHPESSPTIVPRALADACLRPHPPAYARTPHGNSPRPKRPGQGLFQLVWQVMGSNHRRLSRRFYSTLLLPETGAAYQRGRCLWSLPAAVEVLYG